VETVNTNAQVGIHPIAGKQALQDCKTFIHRFDSDRRLQLFSIPLTNLTANPSKSFNFAKRVL
jgi:hypothetical protein